MMLEISWDDFKTRYFTNNAVFAYEYDDRWCFYTHEGPIVVKAELMKLEDTQDEILLEAALFHNKYNVMRLPKEPDLKEEDYDEYPQFDV